MTALELTPVGVATKGLKGAQAAPSILQTLCFEEGTLVLTDVGLKPIEDIREGDQVLSYNENTKQTEFKIVVQTFERVAEAGRILSVSVEGETAPLGVTREHPFYVRIHRARDNTSSEDDDGEWIEAGKLRIGDEIRRANGDWAKVESVAQRNDGAKVYNFEVADNHNYFVGQTHLLAHNTCFLSARELAIRLNVTEREFHRKIKRQILNKAREAVNELRSRNPDIGISEKGTIVIRDPRNRSRSIDTGISFDNFVQ